jgi:hypothetical protein
LGSFQADQHGSGNCVFVAPVSVKFLSVIELQLIWQLRNQLEYNRKGKLREANVALRLRHVGDAPVFIAAPPNKSLDASGGSVFRILTGPAMLE